MVEICRPRVSLQWWMTGSISSRRRPERLAEGDLLRPGRRTPDHAGDGAAHRPGTPSRSAGRRARHRDDQSAELFALGNHFYADTSHVRPVHPETLRFICEQIGLRDGSSSRSARPTPTCSAQRDLPDGSGGRRSRALLESVFGLSGLRNRRHQVIPLSTRSPPIPLRDRARGCDHQPDVPAPAPSAGDRIRVGDLRRAHCPGSPGSHPVDLRLSGIESELLLLHHSIGYEAFDEVIGLPNRIVVVYHNVTPERYFENESVRTLYSARARAVRALGRRALFGVAVSNFNRREMLAAGFRQGRGPAGAGRFRRLQRRSERRSPVRRLALCRADRGQQVPARPGHGVRSLPPDVRSRRPA